MPKIPSPEIAWAADGSPQSTQFGDIYFSTEDGLAETRHVFLTHNQLPDAWAGRKQFTIAETGFGTGLNFLATLAAWQETSTPGQSLNYVSVEGFPLGQSDLERALKLWPELEEFAAPLIRQYPAPHRGTHLLSFGLTFAGNVTLTLIEDDVLAALQGLDACVDAWFLDGFAPATNPDMWSEALFSQIARLSADGASFATFTAAGAVRRGLSAVGFAVEKVPGFGRKREMLAGRFRKQETAPVAKPWYQRPDVASQGVMTPVAIVGAGIAGVSAAAALSRVGIRSTLIDETGLGSGASGNPAGLFMPRMAVDESAEGRFHISAYLHMERWLANLPAAERVHVFRPCGVLQIARNAGEAKRYEKIATQELLPPGHLEFVAAEALPAIAGFETGWPALFYPKGGVITPPALVQHLAGDEPVTIASVRAIEQRDGTWALLDETGALISQAATLVLANGAGLANYSQTEWLPLEPVRGQLTEFGTGVIAPCPHAIVAGHYLISHPDGSALTGATYDLGEVATGDLTPTELGHRRNLQALGDAIPSMADALQAIDPAQVSGRVAYRAQVPDRVPFAGAAPDHPAYAQAYDRLRHGDRFAHYPPAPYLPGLFLFGGLGARGFATALLLGEHLAAQMTGAPLPLPRDIAEAVHPGRFIVRALRKNVS